MNQVDALKKMVNEFSEYARSPAPHFDKLDLNKLIREVTSLYDLPKIRMHLNLTDAPCIILGDTTILRQVLHNLLQNAQDALLGKVSGLIVVSTDIDSQRLVLTVQDNGGGFSTEMMPQIFEPYVTTKSHGTGLGLAIVKKIIDEHKGSIQIENNGNIEDDTLGARVSIRLPLYSASTEI